MKLYCNCKAVESRKTLWNVSVIDEFVRYERHQSLSLICYNMLLFSRANKTMCNRLQNYQDSIEIISPPPVPMPLSTARNNASTESCDTGIETFRGIRGQSKHFSKPSSLCHSLVGQIWNALSFRIRLMEAIWWWPYVLLVCDVCHQILLQNFKIVVNHSRWKWSITRDEN